MSSTERPELMKQIRAAECTCLRELLQQYVGNLHTALYKPFNAWMSAQGFLKGVSNFTPKHLMINLAYNLHGDYDLGVGIALGGLEPAYFFSLFGLEVLVCECHVGLDFRWAGDYTGEHLRAQIAGKRVVVIDEDIVSGNNSTRTVNEILKYKPKGVDLALVYETCDSGAVKRASKSYGRVVTSAEFGYKEFDKAVEIVERAVCR